MTEPSLASEIESELAKGADPGPDPETEAAAIIAAARREAPSSDKVRDQALAFAHERALGKPLAYVIGRVRFMGLELLAAPGALVPRPETELLGQAAVDLTRSLAAGEPGRPLRVIDMCCGAGNLACAIAWHAPTARVWACDLTSSCVEVACRNVQHLDLGARVEVFEGDLFSPLRDRGLEESVEIVVTNPPYISSGRLAADRAALLRHEPREAFDGGPYGLSIHQRVIRDALAFLIPGGTLLFEIGQGQAKQVRLLFERSRAYEGVYSVSDDAGHERVVAGKKR